MNQLIRCINCDAVFLKTPFDQEPEYEGTPSLSPYSVRAVERDDFKDFVTGHDGHRFEELTVISDSLLSDKDYIEPVKVSYFRATNGKEHFVIRKFREKIGDPLRYEMISGDYSLECISLGVQARDISKQMEREFRERPLSKEQIDSFIKLYEHLVKTVDVKNLEKATEESPNPLVVYYKMDDVTLMYLLRNCHRIVKRQEFSDMEEFINRHKDDGVLLLKATYKIRIVERSKGEKKAPPTAVSAETQRMKATI
jgi:hypothetical protein